MMIGLDERVIKVGLAGGFVRGNMHSQYELKKEIMQGDGLRSRLKGSLLGILISFILSVSFALIFYFCNTPLGPSVGSDNAMYLTMGTALAQGYAPYVQIFDHKGPFLFLIQWLPQVIGGGYSLSAVFMQEVVVLFVCLLVLRAIAVELNVSKVCAQLLYLAWLCAFCDGGNLTEEYANLPTLIGLYMALRVFGRRTLPRDDQVFIPAAVMGACAMSAFLFRANNVLPLMAMILVFAVGMAAARRYAALARCVWGFLLGCGVVLLPVVIWLTAQGALREAVYGAIVHNMMYAETNGRSRLGMLLHSGYGHAALLMAACACAGALALYKRRGAWLLALSMVAGAAGGGLAAFISHKFYDHYLMLGAPLAAFGGAALLTLFEGRRGRAAVCTLAFACCMWLGVKGVETNEWRLSEREGLDAFYDDAQALMAQVPESERDRFMAYRVEPKWYVAAEALPCMRFYFLQEILAQADPAVMDEIVATFEADPPLWLVIYYNRPFEPPYDARVAAIMQERYAFVDAAGQYQLLRLKASGAM